MPVHVKHVRAAYAEDLEILVELFDSYRSFYGCFEDRILARQFMAERLQRHDSVIFLAEADTGKGIGFTQLYPTFSSVSARRAWILNDLYVAPAYRKSGIATQLVRHAVQFAKETGAAWITLQTGNDNLEAQALYTKLGFKKEDYFQSYMYAF